MAGNMKIEGLDEFNRMLGDIEKDAPKIASRALYKGAAVVRDAMRAEMGKVKTAPFKYAQAGETRLPSPEEKAILDQAGIGIAKFDHDGLDVNTSIGFNQSGFANVSWNHMSSQGRTNYKAVSMKGHGSNASSFLKTVGQGRGAQNQKPVGVIANAINSGTSFMKKQPFVRKGGQAGGAKALQVMQEFVEDELDKKTK
jgi:hypothetical protein